MDLSNSLTLLVLPFNSYNAAAMDYLMTYNEKSCNAWSQSFTSRHNVQSLQPYILIKLRIRVHSAMHVYDAYGSLRNDWVI